MGLVFKLGATLVSKPSLFMTIHDSVLQEQFKKLVEIEERILEGLQGESIATASRVRLLMFL